MVAILESGVFFIKSLFLYQRTSFTPRYKANLKAVHCYLTKNDLLMRVTSRFNDFQIPKWTLVLNFE